MAYIYFYKLIFTIIINYTACVSLHHCYKFLEKWNCLRKKYFKIMLMKRHYNIQLKNYDSLLCVLYKKYTSACVLL